MRALRIIFSTVVGLAFGLASGLALLPAAAALNSADGTTYSTRAILAVVLIGGLIGAFAPTIRRAFGRGFLLLGVSVFALPLSMLLLSGRVASEMVAGASAEEKALTAVGSGLGGALMTGASAFIGFFLGAILIVIGLILALGGRREVVVIDRTAPRV